MIELVFNENAAQALKRIKNRNSSALKVGEILVLNLFLDLGDISDITETDISSRSDTISEMYGAYSDKAAELIQQQNEETLAKLRDVMDKPAVIRMWATKTDPHEICAVAFISRIMYGKKPTLVTSFIPVMSEKSGILTKISSTAEALEENFTPLMGDYKFMSKAEIFAYAMSFMRLQKENSPVRAIVNGQILGVNEDFYDDFIINLAPYHPFPAAYLMGRTISMISGVRSEFVLHRILTLIDKGIFELLEDSSEAHEKILRKAEK